jgi:hypothetical protein
LKTGKCIRCHNFIHTKCPILHCLFFKLGAIFASVIGISWLYTVSAAISVVISTLLTLNVPPAHYLMKSTPYLSADPVIALFLLFTIDVTMIFLITSRSTSRMATPFLSLGMLGELGTCGDRSRWKCGMGVAFGVLA